MSMLHRPARMMTGFGHARFPDVLPATVCRYGLDHRSNPFFIDKTQGRTHIMNTKPDASSSSRQPPRLPKGPLIIIVLVLASLAWVYWLTRSTPRPPPEIPPLRQLPFESNPEQEPRPDPSADAARQGG